MNKKRKQLLAEILTTPGFIRHALKGRGIEVKHGRFSPLYLNVKCIWSHPSIFSGLCDELKKMCVGSSCVIGIETGGSPFASVIAKELETSLVIARKTQKDASIFAGEPIHGGGSVAIIDDVLATGLSMKRCLNSIQSVNRRVSLVVAISYGMDMVLSKKYGVAIPSLYSIDDVIEVLPALQARMLRPRIRAYQKTLSKLIAES